MLPHMRGEKMPTSEPTPEYAALSSPRPAFDTSTPLIEQSGLSLVRCKEALW
jgi:hypothetical protein